LKGAAHTAAAHKSAIRLQREKLSKPMRIHISRRQHRFMGIRSRAGVIHLRSQHLSTQDGAANHDPKRALSNH
jgi:hypothetical protein